MFLFLLVHHHSNSNNEKPQTYLNTASNPHDQKLVEPRGTNVEPTDNTEQVPEVQNLEEKLEVCYVYFDYILTFSMTLIYFVLYYLFRFYTICSSNLFFEYILTFSMTLIYFILSFSLFFAFILSVLRIHFNLFFESANFRAHVPYVPPCLTFFTCPFFFFLFFFFLR